ncbi:hypothetical protein GCM10009584_01540 [Ornithinimicrobium humiphilum]|uniref:Uncharacterized protein DUF2500 n=1 Tax=Ornithinimicrobium humiphilum TaxID=125288 RepID=A0A543KRL5_9MICO|nr:DUF2500 domain-containing protein [Ornithinimicrobium humiphilum]TQM97718.1 uncharacterized protein DUF2500 [Ornithinimicrobium humiphilum]
MSLTAPTSRWSQDGPDLPDDVFLEDLPAGGVLDPGSPFGSGTASTGDGLFAVAPLFLGVVVLVVVVMVVVRLAQGARTIAENSAQPERTVSARVIGKRTQVEGGGNDTPVRSLYFVTFQLPDGERVELKVPARLHGQVAEGDEGRLTHQGTWFRGFERRRVIPVDGTWEAPGGPSLTPPPG